MTYKKIFNSKTFWTGLATICTGLGMYFTGEQNLQELIVSALGVVFIILRLATDTGVEL